MKQKWVYPTLLLFVVFYVLSSPEAAGPQARDFAGWVGDQAGAVGQFLDGLFDDNDADVSPSVPLPTNSVQPSPSDVPPAGGNGDSFNT